MLETMVTVVYIVCFFFVFFPFRTLIGILQLTGDRHQVLNFTIRKESLTYLVSTK